MARGFSAKLEGVVSAQKLLQALPSQVNRARRNAVSATLTVMRRESIAIISDALGIQKKLANRNIRVERPRQGSFTGAVVAKDRKVRIDAMKFSYTVVSRTQASVHVKDEIGGATRTSGSAFINPVNPGVKVVWRRPRGHTRLAVPAYGPSFAIHLAAVWDKRSDFRGRMADTYAALFADRLDKQLRSAR